MVVARFAFEELRLHRLQIAIIPRNTASRRVVEKLDVREEGTALRYLEINGVWEDHVRYAITAEDWAERRDELCADLDRLNPRGSGGQGHLELRACWIEHRARGPQSEPMSQA